jgi:hypothetical protein
VASAGSQALFFSGTLWAQKFTFGGLESLMAATSLFSNMSENIPFPGRALGGL